MDLSTLAGVLGHHAVGERAYAEVKLIDEDGRKVDVLSLTWDSDDDEWVIVGDHFRE